LIAYSTYYMAWFMLLFMAIWVVAAGWLGGWKALWREAREIIRKWRSLLPGAIAGVFILGLFLKTYLAQRLEHGGRTLGQAIKSLPQPWDFLNHSETNLLWGKVNGLLHAYHPRLSHELELGPTFLFFILVMSAIAGLVWFSRGKPVTLQRVTALATLLSFTLLVRISLLSLWVIPFLLIPGASGIRAAFRFMILLMVPAIYLLILALQQLRGRVHGVAGALLLAVAGGLVVVEQVQLVPNGRIDRTALRAELAGLPTPPADADFFTPVSNKASPYEASVLQNRATFYAQHWNLPTTAGRSGMLPKGWDMMTISRPHIHGALIRWCELRNIRGTGYFFNMDTRAWERPLHRPDPGSSLAGVDLTALVPSRFKELAIKGWSQPERWGVWSTGPVAVLQLPDIETTGRPLALEMTFGAFLDDRHPAQRIRILVDGDPLFDGSIDLEGREQSLEASIPAGSEVLVIETPDAASPESLGISGDTRVLGVALKKLVILAP
jgi:hypothetical protein